jgi:hypothetical protein
MVIDGKEISKRDFAVVKFERERICLPPHFAMRARLAGTTDIEFLLLVLAPGRYRFVRQPTENAAGDLSVVLDHWERMGAEGNVFDGTDNNARAAIRARLIPCTVSPPPPGWRISLPKEAMDLATGDRTRAFLLIVAGFVEVWFPDALRAAVSAPLSELMS